MPRFVLHGASFCTGAVSLQLADVVHEAIEQPLCVHLGRTAQAEALQAPSVSDVGEHGLARWGGAKAASADERTRSSLLAALDAEGEDDELDDAARRRSRRGTPHPLAASPGQGARWQDASMQSHSRRAVARDLHYLCQQRACIEIQYWRGLTGTLWGAYGVVGFRGVKDAPKSVLIADASASAAWLQSGYKRETEGLHFDYKKAALGLHRGCTNAALVLHRGCRPGCGRLDAAAQDERRK